MTPLALGALVAALTLVSVPAATVSPSPPARAPVVQAGPYEQHQTGGAFDRGVWPVSPAVVVTPFDDPPAYAPGHRGVDLSAAPGQVVVAAGDGTVTTAGPVAGRQVVVVAHTATARTTYLPVAPLVAVGDRVRAGEPIGVLTAPSHCLTTTCLHWGARRGDRYVDPRSLLPTESGPIVLLPVDDP